MASYASSSGGSATGAAWSVFAPMASLVLPRRLRAGRAEELLLTGRVVEAEEALELGLVDEVGEDPTELARAFVRERLQPLSASSLALASRAARHDLDGLLGEPLERLERLYLDELMATSDAEEGLRAFLDKREPRWRHR